MGGVLALDGGVARLGLVSVLALVFGLAAAAPFQADILTYTLTGGTISGSLNGNSFSGATFTITATGDPAADVTTATGGYGESLFILSAASAITIAGAGSATLDSSFKLYSGDYGDGSGYFQFGTGDYASGYGLVNNISSGNSNWDLSTPLTITGSLDRNSAGNGFITNTTTARGFYVTGFSGPATLTITAAAVPEPGTLAMGGLLALGGDVLSFRRLRRKAA